MITSAIQGWVVSALMAVGLVLMAVGWHGTYQTLEKERAQHEQVVQQFKDAQLEANRKAEAKRAELEQKAIKDAAEADKRYGNLLAEYRANLLRFKANQGGGTGPSGGEDEAAASTPGPSQSPELSSIVISMKDAEICAINTARLQAARDWALTQQQ